LKGDPDLNYTAHVGCYGPRHELCLCWPLRLELSSHSLHLELLSLSPLHRRDDLRLSCLLAQALMPLESIADLSDVK